MKEETPSYSFSGMFNAKVYKPHSSISLFMSQVRDRLLRIEALLNHHKAHPEWDERRLIDEMCAISGIRPRRVQEYIEILKRAERW